MPPEAVKIAEDQDHGVSGKDPANLAKILVFWVTLHRESRGAAVLMALHARLSGSAAGSAACPYKMTSNQYPGTNRVLVTGYFLVTHVREGGYSFKT